MRIDEFCMNILTNSAYSFWISIVVCPETMGSKPTPTIDPDAGEDDRVALIYHLNPAKRQKKEQRHEEREERRKEMEHVPKTYWDDWDQERADDI